PWITNGLLKSIRYKDHLHLKAKNNPKNIVLLNSYKRYRNKCDSILQQAKDVYESKILKDANGDSKETWKCIKSICNLGSQRNKNIELLQKQDKPIDSLNQVNEYFSSIGKNLASCTLGKLNLTEEELASRVDSPKTAPLNSFFISLRNN
ncbi:Uncharacterized protein OBRU01_24287, partial [Operophtera brumata]